MRGIGIGLLLAVGMAGAASAAPFVAVDASPNFVTMMDQASVVRSGAMVDAEFLIVPASGAAQLGGMRFNCNARTWQQMSQRGVAADLTLSPIKPIAGVPAGVSPGSLGASMVERACFNRQVNTTGGWTAQSLGDAIRDGRAVLARAAAKR